MLGIIGGTGLYKLEGIEDVSSQEVETPFGPPSSEIIAGVIKGQRVAFLPRHGTHHQILPSEINFRANIWALKAVGVRKILSVSAVGSLREEIRPGDLVLPEQYFDWTRGKRNGTFFGDGIVAHVSTANAACPSLQKFIQTFVTGSGSSIHAGKTYACVEGPRLGTRAESQFLRQVGCDVVGMTNIPEAFLAREAQLCYSTIAIATDYDCWLPDPSQHATVDKVIELYTENIGKVQALLRQISVIKCAPTECGCRSSLKHALLTDENGLLEHQKKILAFLRE